VTIRRRGPDRAAKKKGGELGSHGRTSECRHPSFEIEMVNGIEIARAGRNADNELPKEGNRYITELSNMAARRFAAEGRGSFLVVHESDPRAAVYLPMAKLAECIDVLIPEALDSVESAVANYDPKKQFVMVNVFSRRRIAITIDAIRPPP